MSVSLVVHASTQDAPYLATTLPHIVRQAGRVSECIVTVAADQRAQLEHILAPVVAAKIVDRIVEIPRDMGARRRIHARYFGAASPALLGEGDAITTRLAGLETATHDVVAWCAADVLIHGTDWVAAGVGALDEHVWIASTRNGPVVERRTLFERWRALLAPPVSVTASHFVCDRRRWYERLRWIDADDPSAYLRDALERHHATAALVDESWHVRPRTHARTFAYPFAQWIDRLVPAVESDSVPASQRDQWLRLEDPVHRSAWRAQLFTDQEGGDRERPTARLLHRGTVGVLPISVVIPIRNRAGVDVANSLASLAWQRGGRPREIVIVSHGSDPQMESELGDLAVTAGATLISVGAPSDPWNKPLALNTGILATDPSVAYVMTMDADMILADNMLETVIAELTADPQRIVLCRSSDLPEGCAMPADILAGFDELRALANLRGEFGTGGIQAIPRSFLVDVRGYDEDMLWWGALDTDLVRRAEARGLRTSWVTDRTAMLHQWHPRKHRILDDANALDARDSWLRNHELMLERTSSVVRNQSGWGAALVRPDRR
ncbi:MAG TPA: glycosyltransferase family 2 protein [Kofleriaceae bacterium]